MTSITGQEWTAIEAWMDRESIGSGPITSIEPLVGGTQNLMARFERAGESYVLRRGPRHLRPRSNDALRREMRVLDALASTDVLHPRFIAGCEDESVLDGAVFYLMEMVDGFNPGGDAPPAYADASGHWHEAGLSVVEGLAALGNIDHVAVGLGDVGYPDGFIERQVPRWLKELDSYDRHDGYPGPDIDGLAELAEWLEANAPTNFEPGIMHGDFHLANVMLHRERPELTAIVDWEMVTIGDPLLDLGWLLVTWPSATGGVSAVGPSSDVGLPTPAEVVAHYAKHSDRDLTHLPWYEAMAGFKLGIILEGTHARACAGKADKAVGDMLHDLAIRLITRSREVAGR